jgi:hypothetical protein
MKALWRNELHVVIETYDSFIELEPMESEERLTISLADPTLVIDPTDGDLDEAEVLRNYKGHCCECPHVDYHTVSVSQSLHVCHACGETFTDAHRTKLYTHFKNSHLS